MDDPHRRGGGGGEERCGGGDDRSAPESILRNSHPSDDSVPVSDPHYHHAHSHDNKSRGNPSYADHYNRQQERRRHHHSFNSEPNDYPAAARVDSNFTCHSLSPCSSSSGVRKRQFSHSNDSLQLQGTSAPDHYGNGCTIVKLYVAGVPKTATREDIGSVFAEHGNIVEIVLIRDKRTGQQGECCFVKYATIEEADRAIRALHDRYTFPGGVAPLTVRYADGQKERYGSFDQQLLKLYVGCVNKQSTDTEIEEIFSRFGIVEDVFIVRDEMRQHRGCAFVQFSRREMAVAAINGLHGSYIMRGCNQPLIVRFADPKKPRLGGPRAASYLDDRVAVVHNDFHPSTYNRCKPELACGSNASESMPNSSLSCSSFGAITGIDSSVECEWSEHMCPDGYPYYYNCVTSESRWEKPEEYALYERQLLKLEEQPQVQISH
ncbi:unnamed protein product [Coffea canephora]|uniref:Flowering time control protein FCA n=1 Tax=Coffea canephora TaxID=49390 RepID=A0A068V914_COFCA|nr:unnamed protein product [Coffea canephora]